jgi:hypothetical protein
MYARITTYKMKPGSREAATEILHGLKGEIMALPGLTQFINTLDDAGTGYVVALTTLPEPPPDSAERIKALWSRFGDHLAAPPEAVTYPVIADWSN